MSHLHAVEASDQISGAGLLMESPLETEVRHLRAWLNVLACDGGVRLSEELNEDTRSSVLASLECMAERVQLLAAGDRAA